MQVCVFWYDCGMKTLYHASPYKDLQKIQPQRTLSKDMYIGDYVFATSDIKLAAMYLVTRGNATLMNTDAMLPFIVIRNNPKDYVANDMGGAIYIVPDTTFKKSPQEGLEKSELVSSVAVTPIDKIIYRRSIDAMKEMGIVIYFVTKEIFDKLVLSKEESKIFATLLRYIPSSITCSQCYNNPHEN